MAKYYLFLVLLFTGGFASSQVSKSVNLNAAGTLRTSLSAIEKSTVTRLTVSGSIDVRDIVYMRDSMSVLANIDITNTSIQAYSGSDGTISGVNTYLANQMPWSAFMSDINLSTIALPNTLKSFDNYAFQGCGSLISVTIPNSVTSIGFSTFKNTPLLSVTIPNSVTSIGDGAFQGCSQLKTISIPNSVTTIGGSAFALCTGLKEIVFPNSVVSIGANVCNTCTELTSVTIPNSVTSIGNYVFTGCSKLVNIKVYNSTPSTIALGLLVFNFSPKWNTILYVPTGSTNSYSAAAQWKDFINIIEFTITDEIPLPHKQLSIYPNPAKDIVTVSGLDEKAELKLYDMKGTLIINKLINNNEGLSVTELPKGYYLVELRNKTLTENKKLIIK